MNQGKYIVIEGNDGTGKSTQVEEIRKRLQQAGIDSVEFHEPAGVPIADAIRNVIKDGSLERDGETNLLLFTAARHEIWKNAEKELAKGKWIVSARNYFSTLAYQGYGEGLSLELITTTMRTFTSEHYLNPDLAVILSIDHTTRNERISQRGTLATPDTFEARDVDFQERVNSGYLEIAKKHSLPVIDAAQSIEKITDEIWQRISAELI